LGSGLSGENAEAEVGLFDIWKFNFDGTRCDEIGNGVSCERRREWWKSRVEDGPAEER
jgi:hypothetical protein